MVAAQIDDLAVPNVILSQVVRRGMLQAQDTDEGFVGTFHVQLLRFGVRRLWLLHGVAHYPFTDSLTRCR